VTDNEEGQHFLVAYQALRSEIDLRVGQQNKCVELSLVFSGTFGAALVGFAAITVLRELPAATLGDTYWVLAVAGGLYVLLQEAILANYIYQTWRVKGMGEFMRVSIGHEGSRRGLVPGAWETGHRAILNRYAAGQWALTLVPRFQPGVVYLSVLTGLVVFAYAVLGMAYSVPWYDTVALCAGWVAGGCGLAYLAVAHLQLARLDPR
jgi:hypothetical protein